MKVTNTTNHPRVRAQRGNVVYVRFPSKAATNDGFVLLADAAREALQGIERKRASRKGRARIARTQDTAKVASAFDHWLASGA